MTWFIFNDLISKSTIIHYILHAALHSIKIIKITNGDSAEYSLYCRAPGLPFPALIKLLLLKSRFRSSAQCRYTLICCEYYDKRKHCLASTT